MKSVAVWIFRPETLLRAKPNHTQCCSRLLKSRLAQTLVTILAAVFIRQIGRIDTENAGKWQKRVSEDHLRGLQLERAMAHPVTVDPVDWFETSADYWVCLHGAWSPWCDGLPWVLVILY